jgi:EAL domain-containing protein (putative c-di-GMP-specific phosphodiesterase class I)
VEGIRLLSHRPSVLFKIEARGNQADGCDVSTEGVLFSGPGWGNRLREVMGMLSAAERAMLFALRLDDPAALPLPAKTVLDRARTDWFPKFLSQGQLLPVFQPLVELSSGAVYGREALIRGRMGKTELRGQELLEAAEVHDALFSFDARARAAALAAGLPNLPDGEVLFVKLDPRAVLDVEGSLRAVWPLVERAGGRPGTVGLELMNVEGYEDIEMLIALVNAHRERGAVISLDDISVGTEGLTVLEALRPDIAKLSLHLCKGIETSPARRHLDGALVEVAHELGVRVVAVGIERDFELEHVQELDIDLGQGFYLGAPNEEMLPVDERLRQKQESGIMSMPPPSGVSAPA